MIDGSRSIKSTPESVIREEFMDPNEPKTEREWWAAHHITALETERTDLRRRYLGVLGLLPECSVHVTEECRECIEQAFAHACDADGTLTWRRILNRIEIEVVVLEDGGPQ